MNIFLSLNAPVISDISQYLGEANPWRNSQSMQIIISRLINFSLVIAAIILVFLIIWSGIQWATAGDDKEAISGAQKRFTSAIIGITVVFSTWAIINLVEVFFGIKLLNP